MKISQIWVRDFLHIPGSLQLKSVKKLKLIF